jgi:hypothetical protein
MPSARSAAKEDKHTSPVHRHPATRQPLHSPAITATSNAPALHCHPYTGARPTLGTPLPATHSPAATQRCPQAATKKTLLLTLPAHSISLLLLLLHAPRAVPRALAVPEAPSKGSSQLHPPGTVVGWPLPDTMQYSKHCLRYWLLALALAQRLVHRPPDLAGGIRGVLRGKDAGYHRGARRASRHRVAGVAGLDAANGHHRDAHRLQMKKL